MSTDRTDPAKTLFERLSELDVATERGYKIKDEGGDLLIYHRGHWRGMWHHSNGTYAWVIAGSREPCYHSSSIDEAVAYATQHIFVK